MLSEHSKLTSLDPQSRVWIFTYRRVLSSNESAALVREVGNFVASWKAHGEPVDGGAEIIYGQFLAVAADKSSFVSGCSIDLLFSAIKELSDSLNLELADVSDVIYQAPEGVRSVSREEFSVKIKQGAISAETIVFDPTITQLSDLSAGKLKLRFLDSWHSKVFPLEINEH